FDLEQHAGVGAAGDVAHRPIASTGRGSVEPRKIVLERGQVVCAQGRSPSQVRFNHSVPPPTAAIRVQRRLCAGALICPFYPPVTADAPLRATPSQRVAREIANIMTV